MEEDAMAVPAEAEAEALVGEADVLTAVAATEDWEALRLHGRAFISILSRGPNIEAPGVTYGAAALQYCVTWF